MLSINLAWAKPGLTDAEILEQYKDWLDTCHDNQIRLVRIFTVRWSINAFYDQGKQKLLLRVLNYADSLGIRVILVINNYTDFIADHYKDFYDDKFTWTTYPLEKKRPGDFFSDIDPEYLKHLEKLLSTISKVKNIFALELMNEIDQADVDKMKAFTWCVSLEKEISNITKYRYKLMLSFSDESWFKYFRKALPHNSSIELTIHNYAYPSHLFSRNLTRLSEKFDTNLLISEYGYDSHESDVNNINVLRYFCSGIWSSQITNRQISPLAWWWEDILKDESYIKVIDTFNKLSPQGKSIVNEVRGVKVNTRRNNPRLKGQDAKKFKYRFLEVLKKPSRIQKERNAIKKFVGKSFYNILQNNNYAIYEIITGGKSLLFLENSCEVTIKIPNGDRFKEKLLNDLVTGKAIKMITVGSNLESKVLTPGCYLIS